MPVKVKWIVGTRAETFHFCINFHSNFYISFLLPHIALHNRPPKIERLETTVIYLAHRAAAL